MDNQLMNFLTSQGLGNGVLLLIALTLYLIILFRKGIVKQLVEECGLATKKDLDDLRTELLRKIEKLQAEQKADIKELRRETDNMCKPYSCSPINLSTTPKGSKELKTY
jgi:hypothetical protein